MSIAVAAAFILVTGIGAVASYVGDRSDAADSEGTNLSSPPSSEWDDEMFARLKDYTRSFETEDPASMAAAEQLQPDVNTMIEGLAARLEAAPEDIKGWKMLGWSYAHTGRYQEAVNAYAKALKIDPSSAELKLAHEEARANAAESDISEAALSLQTDAGGRSKERSVEQITTSEVTPSHEGDATARTMVDRLAHRLESSPRDVDGWTLLMRCRVVLGEKEVAAADFRKALSVFKDDSVASGKITAAANALGLKAE
jgi:tetratricopeptide (TPR) repeat protein